MPGKYDPDVFRGREMMWGKATFRQQSRKREESCSIGSVFCMSGSFNDNTSAASMGWMEVIYGGHLFFPNTRELYCYLNTLFFNIVTHKSVFCEK